MIPEPAALMMQGSDRVWQVWVGEMEGKRREKGGGEMGVLAPSSPTPSSCPLAGALGDISSHLWLT